MVAISGPHIAAWIFFVRSAEGKALTRGDLRLAALCATITSLALIPDLAYSEDGIYEHAAPWLGSTYRVPLPTLASIPLMVVVFMLFWVVMRQVWLMTETSRAGTYLRRAGVLLFGLTVFNTILRGNNVVATPNFIELGYLALIHGVFLDVAARFIVQAQHLSLMTETLEEKVRERGEELVRAHAQLAHAERLAAIGQLASRVGHEINNPLTYVVLNLDEIHATLKRRGGEDPLVELASDALEGTERIRCSVADLRLLARSADAPSASAPVLAASPRGPLRILLVEDDPHVAASLARVLSGHSVERAASTALTRAALADHADRIDLIICDMVLGDGSGAEIYEDVRSRCPRLYQRFLFISGGALDEASRNLLESGSVRWLPKPIRPEALLAAMAAVSEPPSAT
jgi:CheY-like chemotaxis protein